MDTKKLLLTIKANALEKEARQLFQIHHENDMSTEGYEDSEVTIGYGDSDATVGYGFDDSMSTEPCEGSDGDNASSRAISHEEECELNNKSNEILTLLKMYGNMKLDSEIPHSDNEETSKGMGDMNADMNVNETNLNTGIETTREDIMHNLQKYGGLQLNSQEKMDYLLMMMMAIKVMLMYLSMKSI